jgi:hypothetical protein
VPHICNVAPLRKFKAKSETTTREYLSPEELTALGNIDWIKFFIFAVSKNIKYFVMERLNVESIYSEIVLLPNGKTLTRDQYKKRVNAGIEQCMRGESISLEDLSKELGYNYADL